ncbi:N-formylglutamate amidohydrolase [Aurantiacibacter poecillastricola]|uniref:N-formylglutamate amidohydrolase n=1 Tax=Aurantiacibacter poecillastricola TaxID=3064385 RepID=UPI00273FA140|nr:N-formylglutamate amidohydrolase [Aurantiacibacter sp. 219JJ12-13]MDP5261722.1 N-formylglutamate amidohydrolase [Aurantiacibacter sp. 219JJ12-13]
MDSQDPGKRDSLMQTGGMIPGAVGRPAFVIQREREPVVPVVIAVPHAGRDYPASLIKRMRHPNQAAPRLEDRFVDIVARRVADATGATLLLANAPRAMIDLNRSPEDVDWDMVAGSRAGSIRSRLAAGRRSRSGLGLVPRRLPGLGELWSHRLHAADLSQRIEQVHAPYHIALAQLLEDIRDRWGAALLLDMHSMPPLGPKSGEDAAVDFVIGDRFGVSCDGNLVSAALDHLEMQGARAAHNRPYAGGYVLDRHGAPARGLSAMQIEICRATYLDSALREPGEGLETVAETLTGLVRRLSEEVSSGQQGFAQAAE